MAHRASLSVWAAPPEVRQVDAFRKTGHGDERVRRTTHMREGEASVCVCERAHETARYPPYEADRD